MFNLSYFTQIWYQNIAHLSVQFSWKMFKVWICCSLFIHLHNGISTTKVPIKRYQYLTTTAHTYSLSWMHYIYILQLWMYSTDSWLAWWHFKCMTPISLAHQLVCHTHGDACTEWPVHGTPFYHNIKRHGTLTIELSCAWSSATAMYNFSIGEITALLLLLFKN